ncbi:unnamed protein product [Arctogadus glacialis]
MRPLEAPATSSEQTARFGGANGTPRSGASPAWTCVWVEGDPSDSFISTDSVAAGQRLVREERLKAELEPLPPRFHHQENKQGSLTGPPRDDPLRGPPGGMDTRGRYGAAEPREEAERTSDQKEASQH